MKSVIQSRQITLARYKLSPSEKRILTHEMRICQYLLEGQTLIGNIYEKVRIEKNLLGDIYVEIPFAELGADKNHYTAVKKALWNLNKRSIEVVDEEHEAIVRLVEMPRLVKKGSGYVSFVIHSDLVKAFLDFTKGYSQYQIETSLSLSTTYAMRLYEMVSLNEDVSKLKIKIDTLRDKFQTGDKYKNNADFIKYIIDTSKKELDEKSPWTFDYTTIREGRKIEYIQFYPKYQSDLDEPGTALDRIESISDKALLFLNADIRNFLLRNGWKKTEIEANKDLWIDFAKAFPDTAEDFITKKWKRALELKEESFGSLNPHGWLINAMKKELEANK